MKVCYSFRKHTFLEFQNSEKEKNPVALILLSSLLNIFEALVLLSFTEVKYLGM